MLITRERMREGIKDEVLSRIMQEKAESEYREITKLSQKLGLPVLQQHLKLVAENEGKITGGNAQRCKTWNRNFWNLMISMVTNNALVVTNFGAGYLSTKDVAAAVTAAVANAFSIDLRGLVNSDTHGILVGTGTTAESFEGYALATKVAHGNGAGQLAHQAHSAITQSYNAGTLTWTITQKRIFNNNSGGTIIIAESALIGQIGVDSRKVMWARDKHVSTTSVLNGGQLTVSYITTLTLPA